MAERWPAAAIAEIEVPKATGAHGDLLVAAGLADLIASDLGADAVFLSDRPRGIVVRPQTPLDETTIAQLALGPGYPYLQPKAKTPVPAGVRDVVNYEAEKEKVARWRANRAALLALRRKGGGDPELEQAILADQPRSDWRLLQIMNMLSAHLTTNELHRYLVALDPDQLARDVTAGLEAMASGRDSELGARGWKASAVQLYNPVAAKGYARLKPDGTDRNDKTKEAWTDPFVELLRYRGYVRVACPYFQGSKGEHIRLYVPIPADVSLAVLTDVATEMRRAGLVGQGPKLDALAVLWIAEYLVEHSEQNQNAEDESDFGLSLAGLSPADVIAGVAVTHYQSLGSARAVSSMTTLSTPGWFRIEGPAHAQDWLEILDEHRRVIRGLHDDHSDEIGLLIDYRRFLERRGEPALWAFLDFLAGYGPFLLRAREAGRHVRAFRVDTFGRLVESMSESGKFARVLADPGFQAVARAVRRATVHAQSLKANNVRDYREIRYDLLPALRRARSLPDPAEFVEVLADFIAKYNAENARRRETGRRAQANVRTDELSSFVRLVDDEDLGPNVVGALLCAYGTCTEPRDQAGAGGEPGPVDAPEVAEPGDADASNEDE